MTPVKHSAYGRPFSPYDSHARLGMNRCGVCRFRITITTLFLVHAPSALLLDTMDKQQEEGAGQLAQMRTAIFNRYLDVVLNHPWKTIIATLAISLVLVGLSIGLHYDVFDFDPVQGFETRGTTLANARLTLDALKRTVAGPIDIMHSQLPKIRDKRRAKVFKVNKASSSDPATWSATSSLRINKESSTAGTTLEPISIDYDDYGVDAQLKTQDLLDPCVQYSAMGTVVPYQYMEYMAKIILEIDENKLFTEGVFRKLCEVDSIIDSLLKRSSYQPRSTPAKHSFNLPFYANCLNFSTPNTCEAINTYDIETLRSTVSKCRQNSSLPMCNSQLIAQVLNYLLPRGTQPENNYAAIVLKIPASDRLTGSLQFYNELLELLQKHFSSIIHVRGAFFNVKNDEFLRTLVKDTYISFISAALVLTCFLIHSRSIFYTMITTTIIFLSMGIAFFFYTMIFRIKFFPSLNLLALVLMIAVGADDAFLLMVYYKRYKKFKVEPYQVGDPYIPLYKEHDRIVRAIRSSVRHSLTSMFVTSATTAVAFISNLTSYIIVLRCFAIYAGITVVINYILVVFLLPSTMTLCCRENYKKFFPEFETAPKLAYIVFHYRYIITAAAAVATVAAAVIVFVKPGLPMPRYNPAKVLRNSNPYEWYDNNEHMFNFSWHRNWKFQEIYIIGVEPIKRTSFFNPYTRYNLTIKEFVPTNTDLRQIEVSAYSIIHSPF
ncbi:hypothetical protein Y032_0631g856 [Ancylostoma ceylanicum]|nr:hypothetical protein Y032_0631g856 [Ancylostoma ceylanicum]